MKLQNLPKIVITLSVLFFTTLISKSQTGALQFLNMQNRNSLNESVPVILEYNIISTEKDGKERTSNVMVSKKGGKYLLEFTAPGDMKGTRFLSLDTNHSYIYLPAFGRVRRIVSNTVTQGFIGQY